MARYSYNLYSERAMRRYQRISRTDTSVHWLVDGVRFEPEDEGSGFIQNRRIHL
jgi:hypothetical protein